MKNTDIDIDVADRDKALASLQYVPALLKDGMKHKTGVYFQDIPKHPLTGVSNIGADEAAELGYFKIDLLNNHIYDGVRDEIHLVELTQREPPWDLFEIKSFVEKLSHIRDYFNVVKSIKPKSVEDLAVIIALIRPGKKHLVGKPRNVIDAEIWKPSSDGYVFKKSHSFAYALGIVVQMNLLVEHFEDEA